MKQVFGTNETSDLIAARHAKGGQRRPRQSDTIGNGDSRMPRAEITWSQNLTLFQVVVGEERDIEMIQMTQLPFIIPQHSFSLFFFRLSTDAAPATADSSHSP